MKYNDGQTTTSPVAPRWLCKHCNTPFEEFGDVTMHIVTVHGINPFTPIKPALSKRKEAA